MNHTYSWHPHNWLHRHKLKQARAVWWSFDHWKYIWTFYSNKFPMKCFSSQQDKKKQQQQKRCWKSLCKWLWKIIMHDQKMIFTMFCLHQIRFASTVFIHFDSVKKQFNHYTFAHNSGFLFASIPLNYLHKIPLKIIHTQIIRSASVRMSSYTSLI